MSYVAVILMILPSVKLTLESRANHISPWSKTSQHVEKPQEFLLKFQPCNLHKQKSDNSFNIPWKPRLFKFLTIKFPPNPSFKANVNPANEKFSPSDYILPNRWITCLTTLSSNPLPQTPENLKQEKHIRKVSIISSPSNCPILKLSIK